MNVQFNVQQIQNGYVLAVQYHSIERAADSMGRFYPTMAELEADGGRFIAKALTLIEESERLYRERAMAEQQAYNRSPNGARALPPGFRGREEYADPPAPVPTNSRTAEFVRGAALGESEDETLNVAAKLPEEQAVDIPPEGYTSCGDASEPMDRMIRDDEIAPFGRP